MRVRTPIISIKFNEYMNILGKVFPVYGDFLSFFTIRIGDLPSNMASWLSKVGILNSELQAIAERMIDAYIKLAFLRGNYVPPGLFGLAEQNNEDPKEVTKDFIEKLIEGEIEATIIDEYTNLTNPIECVQVMLLRYSPEILNDEVSVFARDIESERDELIRKVTESPPDEDTENLSYLIVVDPLTYRLSKNFIKELKQKIDEKMGKGTVLSTDELLSYLGLNREIFESDWSHLRAKAVEMLKKKYKFLALHEEIQRIRDAQKEIKEAFSKLAREDLREADCKEIIRQVGIGVEGLLGAFYHWSKQVKPPEETFGQMLNELRSELIDEFGKDTYDDLHFIVDKRNDASHPKQVKLSYEDALKVGKRAELFQALIFRKLGLRED